MNQEAPRRELLLGLLASCRQRIRAAERELVDARQLRDSAIGELAGMGLSHTEIARHAGVTRVRITDIARGRTR